ncbi:MAG: PASTA domain-containing protein [Desulfatibacillum sp.]|nr:PASTA domain-containing protein [Desulfatibacillum sp.]
MIKKLPKFFLYVGIFVLALGGSAYFSLHFLLTTADTVVVPSLVGKDVVYVLETLSAMGLNTKVAGRRYHPVIPENSVVTQEPEAGSEIKKDRDVRIVLSAGPETLSMPNLVGTDLRKARIWLEDNDLSLAWVSRVYDDAITDTILAQNPLPPDPVERGGEVRLLVSMGKRPKAMMMPDFSGLSPEDAILLAERWGFKVEKIHAAQTVDRPPDVVVDQSPAMGYRVMEGQGIEITVNRPRHKDGPERDGGGGMGFISFRVPAGFLKSHMELKASVGNSLEILFDEYVQPGTRLWFLLPDKDGEFFLYRDGETIKQSHEQFFYGRLKK